MLFYINVLALQLITASCTTVYDVLSTSGNSVPLWLPSSHCTLITVYTTTLGPAWFTTP